MFGRPDPILRTVPGKRKLRRLRGWPQGWVSRGLGSQDCYSMACATPQSAHVIFPGAMFLKSRTFYRGSSLDKRRSRSSRET